MTVPFPATPVFTINPQYCPVCGEANACAMEIERESGVAQAPCWCLSAEFNASLFEQLPEAARGQACICARCVAQAAISTPIDRGTLPCL